MGSLGEMAGREQEELVYVGAFRPEVWGSVSPWATLPPGGQTP